MMKQAEAAERVKWLREQIDYHSRRYYDEDAPEIEDDAFDALTRELRELETAYPQLITADSYTQRVHGELSALFEPVTHEVPLGSLQDVFSEQEIRDFDRRIREVVPAPQYVVEPKIDGLSVAIEYRGGRFTRRASPRRRSGGGGCVGQSAADPGDPAAADRAGGAPDCARRGVYAAGKLCRAGAPAGGKR